MARKGFIGTIATSGNHAAKPAAAATSTGDVVLEWDNATVTTLNQLRDCVAGILRQISGTTLLTN